MGEELNATTAVGDNSPRQNRSGSGQEQPTLGITQWFDIRVFYVRIASCPLDDTPDTLTMCYPPQDISALEVNGGKISPSEELKLTLRRDRLTIESSEVTYVSTDNFRTSGTVSFEVFDGDQMLLLGSLEKSDPSTGTQNLDRGRSTGTLSKSIKLGWKMNLTCAVTTPECTFLKGRPEFSAAGGNAPTMEVCVVGRFSESPVILTEIVQLTVRRKLASRTTLNDTAEGHDGERTSDGSLLDDEPDQVPGEERRFSDLTDKALTRLGNFYGSDGTASAYAAGEDGELSWFNAGVRVGVGIGLGMCLGVGIGVGLLMRTYQATTRTFRRKLF